MTDTTKIIMDNEMAFSEVDPQTYLDGTGQPYTYLVFLDEGDVVVSLPVYAEGIESLTERLPVGQKVKATITLELVP